MKIRQRWYRRARFLVVVLMAVALLGFGTTNISLGIIAEYLWRILDASRKRSTYIVDSVMNLSSESTP